MCDTPGDVHLAEVAIVMLAFEFTQCQPHVLYIGTVIGIVATVVSCRQAPKKDIRHR